MLKPVTNIEKGIFTAKIQTEKAVDELLLEAIEDEYVGLIDIWPKFELKNKKFILILESKKVITSMQKLTNPDAIRFQILPDKTVKRLT